MTNITLELTPLEATVVKSLVGCIIGDSQTTLRKVTNELYDRLEDLGVVDNLGYFLPDYDVLQFKPDSLEKLKNKLATSNNSVFADDGII